MSAEHVARPIRARAIAGAWWACCIAAVIIVPRAHAQSAANVAIFLPPSALHGDSLRSPTPTFVVQAVGFSAARPLRVTLQVSTSPRFDATVEETTILAQDTTSTVLIAPLRALAEGARVYYRATVVDPNGTAVSSAVGGPLITPPWVTLVSPPNVVGQPVRTRTPTFVWRPTPINEPPGPWEYTITISNPVLGSITSNVGTDTTFVPSQDLEPNAPYTWELRVALPRTTQVTTARYAVTFVVEDSAVPTLTTSLSPPFPNPFPNQFSPNTCLWFDLKADSRVTLDVYDLRGVHVRRLVPNEEVSGMLAAGRYGRGRTELNEGCDRRFGWDGTDDRGRTVPEGVYLIRFKGDGREFTRKVLFRGR